MKEMRILKKKITFLDKMIKFIINIILFLGCHDTLDQFAIKKANLFFDEELRREKIINIDI
jgi:hypothetical protein